MIHFIQNHPGIIAAYICTNAVVALIVIVCVMRAVIATYRDDDDNP